MAEILYVNRRNRGPLGGRTYVPASAGEILVAAALELERWVRVRYAEEPDGTERLLAGAERALDGIRAMLAGTVAGRELEAEIDS